MRRVGLHLTDRCQLDCDHCLRDPEKEPVDLALDVVDAVLRDASQRLGIQRVSLTGGEPTLHPRFSDVLDLVVAYGMRWDAVTNGKRFERVAGWLEAAPERRSACSSVVFSVDGASDEVHDGIRGAGQRREVLEAMAIAVAIELPFATSTALHARNVGELEAIARECAALGATSVRFAMLQPTGTHLDAGLWLSREDWSRAEATVRRLAAEGLPVVLTEGWPGTSDAVCDPLRGDTLHVDHRGRLTMCCLHSGIPGHDETIAGDARRGLEALVPRLDEIRRKAIEGRARSEGDAWASFGCNACLRRFGRPHWIDDGAAGATARRERWGSARRLTLHVVQ